jgi:uncharacterized protein YqfA (UPF0365 family)
VFDDLSTGGWIALILIGVLVLLLMVFAVVPIGLAWMSAKLARVDFTVQDALGARLRGASPGSVVWALRYAKRCGLPLDSTDVETYLLVGGDARGCVRALCRARELGQEADWILVSAIELAGYDVERVVESGFDLRTFVGGPDPGGRKEALWKRPT